MKVEIRDAIKVAIKEAKKSICRYRLGAVGLNDGVIISRGHNLIYRSEYPYLTYDFYSPHAEAVTIMRAKRKIDTLVVVRIIKDDALTCSMPCKKCHSMIKDAGIERVMYCDWDGNIQELRMEKYNGR